MHSAADLVSLIHEKGLPRSQVAALAGLVQKAADRGDAVAAGLLGESARELAACVRAVAARLAFGDEPYPVVLAGGLFRACPSLGESLIALVDLPKATLRPLNVEPAAGAVTLATEMLE